MNASSLILSCEKMTKMRSLCTKYEIILSQNSYDMGFFDRIYHKLKLKKMPCHSDEHMAAWASRKEQQSTTLGRELGTRRLRRTRTFILGSTIFTCTKKGWNLSLGCRLLWPKKIEKSFALYHELLRLLIHWRETYISPTYISSRDTFRWRSRKRVKI